MRHTLTVFVLMCSGYLFAQNAPQYNIWINYENDTLRVNWDLYWINHTTEDFKEIPLVFLPKAVAEKKSFFRKEKIEDQDKTLHFKLKKNTSHLTSEAFTHLQTPCKTSIDPSYPEATWVLLNSTLNSGDTLKLRGMYNMHIGEYDVVGWRSEGLWLQHLIHHLPHFDSGWSVTPLNRHANYNRRNIDVRASFNVPEHWNVFTNMKRVSKTNFQHSNTKDIFAVIGPEVFPKPSLTDWTVYHHDPTNVAHIYTSKLRHDVTNYLKTYIDDSLPEDYSMLSPSEPIDYFDPGCGIILLPYPGSIFTSADAAYSLSILKTHVKTSYSTNAFSEPWAGDGLSRFLRDDFIEKTNRSILLSSGIPDLFKPLSRIFPVGNFPLTYQNHIMYFFLARQGLDQPAGASYEDISAGNYLAIVEGKTAIGFRHLRGRIGKIAFYKSLQKWRHSMTFGNDQAAYKSIRNALQENTNKNIDWFFDTYLFDNPCADYRITRIQKCSYIYAVTVQNRGQATFPYPLTGLRNGKEIITIWYDGHQGKQTVQFHLEDYDEIILDHKLETIDLNPRNNRRKETGLFRGARPVKLQLYTDIENPEREQIFFYPVGGFNAYDGLYGGISFYNRTRIPKRWEYRLEPTLSTRTRSLTGSASLVNNILPSSGWFHRITPGMYFHHYHYDTDLAYYRFSPFIRFWWRKSHPRSENIHRTRLRYLQLERETIPDLDLLNANYSLIQLTHDYENVNILHPCSIRGMIEVSDLFSKIQIDIDQRWMLPNKKWMSTRFFAGVFAHRNLDSDNNFFDFGMSGTLDYSFDYYLFGRSETAGLLSQQMIFTDGGFKSQTNVFASQWISAFNTYIPIWSVFGVFGDVGLADNIDKAYWGYGIRISLLTDFFELYFPIQNQDRVMWEHAYPREIRFMINIDMNQIVQRVRRGWY